MRRMGRAGVVNASLVAVDTPIILLILWDCEWDSERESPKTSVSVSLSRFLSLSLSALKKSISAPCWKEKKKLSSVSSLIFCDSMPSDAVSYVVKKKILKNAIVGWIFGIAHCELASQSMWCPTCWKPAVQLSQPCQSDVCVLYRDKLS